MAAIWLLAKLCLKIFRALRAHNSAVLKLHASTTLIYTFVNLAQATMAVFVQSWSADPNDRDASTQGERKPSNASVSSRMGAYGKSASLGLVDKG
jgi:hypothetical protein